MKSIEFKGTMKIFLTIALTAGTLGMYAQNANVVSAYMYMKDGNLAKAAEFIEPAIVDAKSGANEKTWRYRGDIYRMIVMGEDEALKMQFPGAIEKSVESYMKANELDTKGSYKIENIKALGALQGTSLNAGNKAFTAKEYDQAIKDYARAEMIAKAFGQVDTNAIFNSALAYESKGDGANAIQRYRDALAGGYNKVEVYRYISSLQAKGNDLDGAIATLSEGRTKFADDRDLIMDQMAYLLQADRAAEAEEMVKLALSKDPNNATLYSVLGSLYDKKAAMPRRKHK